MIIWVLQEILDLLSSNSNISIPILCNLSLSVLIDKNSISCSSIVSHSTRCLSIDICISQITINLSDLELILTLHVKECSSVSKESVLLIVSSDLSGCVSWILADCFKLIDGDEVPSTRDRSYSSCVNKCGCIIL